MIIARWQIEARFGHKQTVIDLFKRWEEEIGSQIGWASDKTRLLTGSIGALESTLQTEVEIKDLAELGSAWDKLGSIEAHKAVGQGHRAVYRIGHAALADIPGFMSRIERAIRP